MSLLAALAGIIPALIPAASDGVRALINRKTGGAGALPANVEEAVQLMRAENERLGILAKLDEPAAGVYAWAATARALQRPALATWVMLAYVAAVFTQQPADTVAQLGQYAQMVTFYLFGSWGYASFKGR